MRHILKAALPLSFLVSCVGDLTQPIEQPERFILASGEKVICRHYEQRDCGMTLLGCGSEQGPEVADYRCLPKVAYDGPVRKSRPGSAKPVAPVVPVPVAPPAQPAVAATPQPAMDPVIEEIKAKKKKLVRKPVKAPAAATVQATRPEPPPAPVEAEPPKPPLVIIHPSDASDFQTDNPTSEGH